MELTLYEILDLALKTIDVVIAAISLYLIIEQSNGNHNDR